MKMDKSTFFTMEDIEKDWSDTFVISTAIRERDEYIEKLEQIKYNDSTLEFYKHIAKKWYMLSKEQKSQKKLEEIKKDFG